MHSRVSGQLLANDADNAFVLAITSASLLPTIAYCSSVNPVSFVGGA